MNSKREIIRDITSRINFLEDRYNALADSGDAKSLQGLERCIELVMRLHGIESKSFIEQVEDFEEGNNSVIKLEDLSTETLKELFDLTRNCTKKAQKSEKTTRTKSPSNQ